MKQLYEARRKKFELTSRESELVSAAVAGRSLREIAATLNIGEDALEREFVNIFDKLSEWRKRSSDDSDFGDPQPLAGDLPALVLSVVMLSIYAVFAYWAFQLLRFLARLIA